MKRGILLAAVILALFSCLIFTGGSCSAPDIDLPDISWDDVQHWAFNEMISLAILAVDRELGDNKAERIDWIAGHLKNTFGDLLNIIPGWESSIENAYDTVWLKLNGLMRDHPDYVEGADQPAYLMIGPDSFENDFDSVMEPITANL